MEMFIKTKTFPKRDLAGSFSRPQKGIYVQGNKLNLKTTTMEPKDQQQNENQSAADRIETPPPAQEIYPLQQNLNDGRQEPAEKQKTEEPEEKQ